MADIFDISYNQKAVELLPPDKRSILNVKWVQSLYGQIQYLRDKILNDYKKGTDYPEWIPGTYGEGALVTYGQTVYQSLINGNTSAPTDATKWAIYQMSFLGVDSRVKYNSSKLVLEYALNERFGTVFRQPELVSDIYIETNSKDNSVFIVGASESESSSVFYDSSSDFIIDSYSFGTTFFNFVIHIPVSVYNAISTDADAREKTVRGFVDQYNSAGITYQIITY